jgi:hypothetical protein
LPVLIQLIVDNFSIQSVADFLTLGTPAATRLLRPAATGASTASQHRASSIQYQESRIENQESSIQKDFTLHPTNYLV